jgi:tetratricopeptide (TPR) repeat protein
MAQGQLPEARKSYEEALALQSEVGDKVGIARIRYFLGSLAVHENRMADAEASLREAAAQFRELKASDEEGSAMGMRARALVAQKNTRDADATIQEAMRLVRDSRNRVSIFEVDLATAHVEAANGRHAAAATRLRKLQNDAKGFLGFELDAALALGEVEVASGQTVQGRARLQDVEKQAAAKGFLLTARQAAAVRR